MSTFAYYAEQINGTQYEQAQHMYSSRAADYDDSWHPAYAQRLMSRVPLKEGDRVLILACGTGLEAIIAAPLVGDNGHIIAIDATKEMLDVARAKVRGNSLLETRITLVQHDITNLAWCAQVSSQGSFDWIICSNAFILLEDPANVIRDWAKLLAPSGSIALDIAHEGGFPQATILETIAANLHIPYPVERSWFESPRSLEAIFERCGLQVTLLELLDKKPGRDMRCIPSGNADAEFDALMQTPLLTELNTEAFVTKVKPLFRFAFEAIAVDGVVVVCEKLWMFVAQQKASPHIT